MERILPGCEESKTLSVTTPSPPCDASDFWDRRAPTFSEHAASTGYAEHFMNLMHYRPEWSVLDMACGGGTLAVPLARKVQRITAVDFSKNMLEILAKRCREEGLDNVRKINGRWEDDWDALGISMHDVAIASRFLPPDNAMESIIKLDAVAAKLVYLSVAVGDGPHDRRLYQAVGRPFSPGPDYTYYYNLLYRMGIHANITFIRERHDNTWDTFTDALDAQRWMFNNLTDQEEDKIKGYLLEHLLCEGEKWRLPYERSCRWAVIWWEKQPIC
ncbi:MAG: methyltransferase domain-containing protein [Geobacteraceae bacterium]|nr:methyltransferase domain-containing protein [Geobacteraceae bacterium]